MKTKRKLVYQLHVALLDVEPMIWRRIRVPDHISFKKLHEAIQIAMGWEDYHLYEFRYGPMKIGIPDGDFLVLNQLTNFDASRKGLTSMEFLPDDFMTYTYDFGDNWVHAIRVEAVFVADEDRTGIECVAGERACPPEDVGGSRSYQELKDLLCRPLSLEKRQQLEDLYGGLIDLESFHPESFDLAGVNQKLKKLNK